MEGEGRTPRKEGARYAPGAQDEGLPSREEAESPMSRMERIVGRAGVEALARATVMIIGVGGVGSNCLEALARGGVGGFVVVDFDTVALSNINRQAIATYDTIGLPKVDAAERLVASVNPDARVEKLSRFVTPENAADLIDAYAGRVSYIVDAIDNVSAKLALAKHADGTEVPYLSCMGAANKLYPELFRFDDIYNTSGDALARIIRREARHRSIGSLRVLYSPEPPFEPASDSENPDQADRRVRPQLGTMSYVVPVMGMMAAGEVIRHICGFGGRS